MTVHRVQSWCRFWVPRVSQIPACVGVQGLRRMLIMLWSRRWCGSRNNNCLRKLVVIVGLFVLLPLAFIFKYLTLQSSILHMPAELDPYLKNLSNPVKHYVLDYKTTCESYVFGSAHNVTHRIILDNTYRYHSVPNNWTRRKLLGFFHRNNQSGSIKDFRSRHISRLEGGVKLRGRGSQGSKRDNSIYCPCVSPGNLSLATEALEEYMALPWMYIEQLLTRLEANVSLGGVGHPRHCVPRQRVAIIIPYRDREEHLKAFLAVMHPFLQRQNLHYQIFVIEQHSPSIFNRASLMNIGYLEAKRHGPFDCYVYQDVDLLPESDLNFYSCYSAPLHIGAYMNKFDYKMPYEEFFGGAMAMTGEQVETINGFPNRFYGWGGEDDDIYMRVLKHNYIIKKHPLEIGKTYMIKHSQDKLNPINPLRFEFIERPNLEDGLSTLQYKHLDTVKHQLYTWVLASVDREYDDECIVDPSLPPSADGNYLNCYREENFDTWSLECCHDNSTVFCCNKTNTDYEAGYYFRNLREHSWPVVLPCIILSLLLFCGAIVCRAQHIFKPSFVGQSFLTKWKPLLPHTTSSRR